MNPNWLRQWTQEAETMLVVWEMRFEILTKLELLIFFFLKRYQDTEQLRCSLVRFQNISDSHLEEQGSRDYFWWPLTLLKWHTPHIWPLLSCLRARMPYGSSKPRQVSKPNKINWKWRFPKVKNSRVLGETQSKASFRLEILGLFFFYFSSE